MVISATTFSGGVTNTGTIGAGGISVVSGAFLSGGGIFDSGVIVGGIKVDGSSKIVASGGVTQTAIAVENTRTFGGGISNAGVLSAAFTGIFVDSATVFTGGIINSGTIAGDGHSGILVFATSTFSGGINNLGKIAAAGTGISLFEIAAFSDGVTNSGTITAGVRGIALGSQFSTALPVVSSFAGNLANTGKIAANTGIAVFGGTVQGAIVDSGTIAATNIGIRIDSGGAVSGGIQVASQGVISAGSHTGVKVENTQTFAGGIANNGTISGGHGIIVSAVSAFAGGVSVGGMILALGGTILAAGPAIAIESAGVFSGGVEVGSNATLAGANGVAVTGATTFAGGISNAGRIVAGSSGIEVKLVTTFTGAISNAGTISSTGGVGIYLSKDAVFGAGSGGGITNSGVISTAHAGVDLVSVATFLGNIVNNSGGKIIAGHGGIDVSTVSVFGTSSAGGGITNSGTISAGHTGIYANAATFLGSIINASGGNIASTTNDGINVIQAAVFGNTNSASSIVNTGTISAHATGVHVFEVSTFFGNINNNAGGVISAGSTGIFVSVLTFAGKISNAGTISSVNERGILVSEVRLFGASGVGGITNTGTISAGFSAIKARDVTVFSGGIENDGTLATAFNGILLEGITTFAGGINNKGTISAGSGGIAVGGSQSDGIIPIATFIGGISNNGNISAAGDSFGILVQGVGAFGGGITNSSAISAGTGIGVGGTTTSFSGGISNSGKILGARNGILVQSGSAFGSTSAGGGISNSGGISGKTSGVLVNGMSPALRAASATAARYRRGNAIFVEYVTSFSGGISNRGSARCGLRCSGIRGILPGIHRCVAGGGTNAGTIRALSPPALPLCSLHLCRRHQQQQAGMISAATRVIHLGFPRHAIRRFRPSPAISPTPARLRPQPASPSSTALFSARSSTAAASRRRATAS